MEKTSVREKEILKALKALSDAPEKDKGAGMPPMGGGMGGMGGGMGGMM